MTDIRDLAASIRLVIFDVDGVFTDGRLVYSAQGEEIKVFHVRDGVGIKALRRAGIELAVISGRSSDAVALRMAELGIKRVYQGDHDKLPLFDKLLAESAVTAEQTAFVGDDLPDLPVLQRVGLAACPADAHEAVRAVCHWVGSKDGGRGAVREFCDFLLGCIPQAAGRER
jgi:3-deoxy-D-manno-octulosonate 8-phosphate phosphatase (KDO 8-P phosphatase)